MNMSSESPASDDGQITRREAIRRAALMAGIAFTPSLMTAVLQAQTAAAKSGATPSFLNPRQFEVVGAIAERILPKTDVVGAKDVGVPAFLDLMYGRFLTEDEKRVFANGLGEIDKLAQAQGGRGFVELSPAEQDRLLTSVAVASQAKEKTFFHLAKELTLLGYFTSEPIGKKVLHYDPIPGRYQGCIPLSEVGNASWTR